MNMLRDMIWIELRKSWRARVPLYFGIGFLLAPLACAFMMFVARDPEFARKAGLISAKANLMAVSADWPYYLNMLQQAVGAGGVILFSLVINWIFGREFADGTIKDLLAVPVGRGFILMGKFIVFALWSAALVIEIVIVGLALGLLLQLPQGSSALILNGLETMALSSGLVILVTLPFAFVASAGRGYLLPVGITLLALALANVVAVIGYGSFFPWSIPMIFAQGKSPLPEVSYWIVALTGLAGLGATYLWWKYADQSR